MGKIIIIVLLSVFAFMMYMFFQTSAGDDSFDEYGVLHVIDNTAVVAGEVVTFGPFKVSDRKDELNIFLYGTTPGESLKTRIKLWGMPTYNPADSTQISEVFVTPTPIPATAGSSFAWADTLEGDERFPFLFGQVINENTCTATIDMYIFMKPEDLTVLRYR